MKLPPGEVCVRAAPLDPKGFFKILSDLMKQSFNGYVAWAGEGADGMEEGIFLFLEGYIFAVSYEHLKYNYSIEGDDAVPPALNVLFANGACYSVVDLGEAKTRLALTFNEKAKLKKPLSPKDIKISGGYSDKWAKIAFRYAGLRDAGEIG